MQDKTSPFVAQLERNMGVQKYARVLRSDPCAYCGGRETVQIDHIIPRHKTGEPKGLLSRAEIGNVTAACQDCNINKATASLLDFLIERQDDSYLARGSRRWWTSEDRPGKSAARRVEIPKWEPDKTLAVAQTLASQLGDAGVLISRLIWQARIDAGWRPNSRPRS